MNTWGIFFFGTIIIGGVASFVYGISYAITNGVFKILEVLGYGK